MSYISTIRTGDDVLVWERNNGEREVKTYRAPYYFYVKDSEGDYTSIYGDKLNRLDFDTSREFQQARTECEASNVEMFESDIPPELKVLSEQYYNVPAPTLHISFLDIEVDYSTEIGFASISNPYAPINSVAIYHTHLRKYVVLAVPPNLAPHQPNDDDWKAGKAPEDFVSRMGDIAELQGNYELDVQFCKDEKELLVRLLAEIDDSDVVCGWNSDFFDIPYIGKRLEKLGPKYLRYLSFPQANKPTWREVEVMGQTNMTLDLSGRISADYMVLFKKYEMAERPSYKLMSIAEEILPDLPKLEYEGSLAQLYRSDFAWFVRYNIRDTEILHGLEDRLGYVELANQMMHLSTGVFKHVTGTLKLAELATINYCHHVLGGLVVNDVHVPDHDGQIKGAFVLDPEVGMHEHIGSVDINSLYPSAIRSINISPETIRGQFEEEVRAAEEIAKGSFVSLVLVHEDGYREENTADDWREILRERQWAVSGFGTVFDQSNQGIIPKILEAWYASRKQFQKKKAEAKTAGDNINTTYYDKLQYVYKIKLNSFYGGLTNKFFRFYDLRMGESTTGTGRMILRHQCAETNKILTGEYNPHGGAIIYGDSVAGDTHIYTDRGTFRIEDLFTSRSQSNTVEKEYCYVNGVRTLTYNPKTGNNEFRNLKYVMRHKANKTMFRVWFGNTRYVDVTEDHSLIGYANTKHKTPGPVAVKPADIGKNHVNGLLLNRHIPRTTTVDPEGVSDEMFTLMGLIVGDGHVEKAIESGVGISVGNEDKQEIVEKLINPLINQQWFTSTVSMKNGHDIRLCGTKGWYFLREHLYPQGVKIVPEWLYDCSEAKICAFLKGYFTADGFANMNKTIGLCSTQLENIIRTNNLLKLCGIPSNYWIETTENSYKGKYSGTFTARLTVYDAVAFGTKIGFILDRKNQNVRTSYGKRTKHMTTQSGFCVVHPTKIERIPTPEYVYDIEVDDTHTFYANDILVHNTDSTYFKTWAEDSDQAVMLADRVGELVNKSFQNFMKETFLCNPDFDDIIKCGREIVSDRGIFVDKKRYILHLINNDDGDPCDKLKVMGLDTKKTTLPKEISAQLNKFVERLLKGEPWEVIAEDIVEYKEKIKTTTDVMSIGLPKGVRGVEDYTQEYKTYGEGTRVPGHVAAAIFYNMCREEFNDRESMPIVSGMKIKVFYLSRKYGKFKSIAIPVDIEQVPSWFLEEFTIDREAHIKRLVDNPLQNIIKAIDKVVPSKQSLVVDSLLGF